MATVVQTKLADQINPEVLGKMISAKLAKKIRFSPIADVDNTLVGQPGSVLTIPTYTFSGEAVALTEGTAMDIEKLETSSETFTIIEAGKGFQLTDTALNSAYGNPLDEAANQAALAVASKVDTDLYTACHGISTIVDRSSSAICYDSIVDGVAGFGEENESDEDKYLVIHSLQEAQLRKDDDFISADKLGSEVKRTGVIGKVAGCYIVISNKIAANATYVGKYINPILKKGALAVIMKADLNLEIGREQTERAWTITATKHFVAALVNDSKAVLLITLW